MSKRPRDRRGVAPGGGVRSTGKAGAAGSRQLRQEAGRQPAWRRPLALATAGAAVLGFVVIVSAQLSRPGATARPPTVNPSGTVFNTPTVLSPQALADGRAIGASGAPATLTVWEDFQCPVCGEFTRQIEPRLYADFVVPGLLRIVYRDWAFIGQESFDAAAAARCAGDQGRFWPYHDYLFWNQGPENGGAFSRARLDAIADVVGLDRVSFDTCLDSGQELAAAKAETAAGATAGIGVTPTLVVDQTVMPGAPLSDLQYAALSNVIRASVGIHSSPSP